MYQVWKTASQRSTSYLRHIRSVLQGSRAENAARHEGQALNTKPSRSRRSLKACSASAWGDRTVSSTTQSSYTSNSMATLETLNFDNLVLRSLPIDEDETNRARKVHGACFSRVTPTAVIKPETVAYSLPALNLLDLPRTELERPDFAEYFGGNKILPGSETAAHCYCGHQFGNFAGQLGDGAAIYLGEVINKQGQRWEIQLKGAGLTPYSRTADGRKVLRSSLREFLCSEAMHHLGIPTTRAGSCVTSDSKVIRDIFYSGNAIEEKCTVVLRIAESFIRFGSFQICKPVDRRTGWEGPSVGRVDVLEQLADYVIKTFYKDIWEQHQGNKKETYKEFFREVVRRTACLVAEWQCVGWCHGVLNTDNMSILGLTMDYGPFGFMDRFDPSFICNASDDGGRYAYRMQPEMCKWNCEKLAEALTLTPHVEAGDLHGCLLDFQAVYDKHYLGKMRKKFGLKTSLAEDRQLIEDFFDTMEKTGSDFTNTLRCLSLLPLPGCVRFEQGLTTIKKVLLEQCCTLVELRASCRPRMDPRQLQMILMLLQTNPEVLAQLGAGHRAISKEIDSLETLKKLKDQTQEQKSENDAAHWDTWLQRYVNRLKLEAEGATDLETTNSERVALMNANNPRFVLRNYIAQNAIDAAETGDYSEVRRVLQLLEDPYNDSIALSELSIKTPQGGSSTASVQDDDKAAASSSGSAQSPGGACIPGGHAARAYDEKPPEWATELKVT